MRALPFILIILCLTGVLCAAGPASTSKGASSWKKVRSADESGDTVGQVIFAIKQRNTEWLQSKFKTVSDPDHPDYGKFITPEELATTVIGEPNAVRAVENFLAEFGINSFKRTGANNYFIIENLPVSVASQMFQADFQVYESHALKYAGKKLVKASQFTLPEKVANAVDFVLGLDNFPSPTEKSGVSTSYIGKRDLDEIAVNPASIYKAYNISNYQSTDSRTTQAVAAFLEQYFSPTDLSTFQSKFAVAPNPIAKVIGNNVASNPGIEADLDVEYITALGLNVATWFIYEASTVNQGQEDFLKYLIGQLNETYTPLVHSISYGDIAASIPDDYKTRVDLEFQKFGVIGRSILIAAGDSGVRCTDSMFDPEWPTSSPYVTSVGGTTPTIFGASVWSGGGGGASNTFSRPDYQNDAVTAYLKSGKAPDTKYFNTTGRMYPDIAAFATGFEIVYRGSTMSVGGTSCATPTAAGIFSLLNDVRFTSGRSPLGFLNPMLYKLGATHPEAFLDITQGSNPAGQCPGFQAIAGWDPASGWGSPNFGFMKLLV